MQLKLSKRLLIGTLIVLGISCSGNKKIIDDNHSDTEYWHGIEREMRYQPDGEDFVLKNGHRRFNRALYGSNTAFRVETGDLPEFSMYLPGMGGNFQFILSNGDSTLSLINAKKIEARYRAGSMHYKINDPIMEGALNLSILPYYSGEGMLIKASFEKSSPDIQLHWIYGGVSGKRFSRDGDIGADPESVFYLTPEKCANNEIRIAGTHASVYFDKRKSDDRDSITAIFPDNSQLKTGDANDATDKLWESEPQDAPVLMGKITPSEDPIYFSLYHQLPQEVKDKPIETQFQDAETNRKALADRIKVTTPDPYLNNLGGALAIAADAVWEDPSFLHGAIAWRMPLVGWRGAYIGDWLGWHDRARTHFSAYAASQYTSPDSAGAAPDPEKNLARQIEERGKSIFTEGYLSRRPGKQNSPHHYDMNLVYIDQLIRHFDWNGDVEYLKEMWPVIERHLDWEKRNFDPDGDGLYNAYASIWASDALEYNGGGVAHSSAYNYYSNLRAAELAEVIGLDGSVYLKEAQKIKNALNNELWIARNGTYGEYKDALGLQRVHPQAGLWSVYHLMDSEVPDAFQAFQLLDYVEREIPQIPIRAKGLDNEGYYTLSTTNWMPYTWSVNNVALAEVLHGALAYWQAGKNKKAYKLWKSALLESMYLGASPGNFQQLSFYDAMRGELYRDFSDPVAMAARTLVEGLFGIRPKMLEDKLVIAPGFPKDWPYASLKTPDFDINYQKKSQKETYEITQELGAKTIRIELPVTYEAIGEVLVNGQPIDWKVETQLEQPLLITEFNYNAATKLTINWKGNPLYHQDTAVDVLEGSDFSLDLQPAQIAELDDPQSLLSDDNEIIRSGEGLIFARLKQGDFSWWEPIPLNIEARCEVIASETQPEDGLSFSIRNNTAHKIDKVLVNHIEIDISASGNYDIRDLSKLYRGTNRISVALGDGSIIKEDIIHWELTTPHKPEAVNINTYFNDKVTRIFENEYLSPRSPYPTLQLPIQGLGDWCSYAAYMKIDDTGLRKLAGNDGVVTIKEDVTFNSPGSKDTPNILFTSLWDNYPDSAIISLDGKAHHAYLLMAGTTNPMQSRFENGLVEIRYKDGTSDILSLRNPETWWPIEQDYYHDGYAFDIGAPKPIRVHLKTGWIGREHENYVSIDHFTNYAIDGGAATVLDLPLNPEKELESLTLKTTANDVVIGLMGVSLAVSDEQ